MNLERGSRRRGAWCPCPRLGAPALALLLAAGCSKSIGHDVPGANGAATADEAVPESLTRFGIALGTALVDPNGGGAAPPQEVAAVGANIPPLGSVVFFGFTTTARADDADGSGHPLDPAAPTDANGANDVFVAALAQGKVDDVALASATSGGGAAAAGASHAASLAWEANPDFPAIDPTRAGWVHVAFESTASDIVGSDNNAGQADVYRVSLAVDVVTVAGAPSLDLVREESGTRAPQRISVANGQAGNGAGGNGVATAPAISGTGDLVAFVSTDSNIVGGDANGRRDVFLRRPSLTLTRRVTAGDGDSDAPVLSGDLVPVLAFDSGATNLVGGDGNGRRDVFFAAIDVATLTLDPFARASVRTGNLEAHGGDARRATLHVISADADGVNGGDGDGDGIVDQIQVAFESDATDLVAALPTPSTTNVYLYDDRNGGQTVLLNQRAGPGGATLGSADGGASPCDSFRPSFAPSGAAVAFETLADNLDAYRPADANHAADVVLSDVRFAFVDGSLRVHRVSVAENGADGNGASTRALFASAGSAAGTVGGVTPFFSQSFAQFLTFDRCQVCHQFFAPGGVRPIGHDGFDQNTDCSGCHNAVGDPAHLTSWLAPPAEFDFRNKSVDQLCQQFRDTKSAAGGIREHLEGVDGRIVWALQDGTVPNGGAPRETLLAHFGIARADWNAYAEAWINNGFQCQPFGSGSGDFILFQTDATNLGAASGEPHVLGFPATVALERVSKTGGFAPTGGKQGSRASSSASITRDDRYVAFASNAAFDATRDRNGASDVYVRDLLLGTTVLVSRAAGSGLAANGASLHPSAAVDAAGVLHVAFESTASDLVAGFVDGNGGAADVWLADFSTFDGSDPATIAMALVSRAAAAPTHGGNGGSSRASLALAATGPVVAFESLATDLIAGFADHDGAAAPDVFVSDTVNGMVLASRSLASALDGGDGASSESALSDDGARVAFTSSAGDLVVGFVRSGTSDVFFRDLDPAFGFTQLLSFSTAGTNFGGDAASSHPACDATGAVFAFESKASDLVAGFVDGNGANGSDIFRIDLPGGEIVELMSVATSGPLDGGAGASRAPALSADGNLVVFESDAGDLVAGDTDHLTDVFLRDHGAGTTRRVTEPLTGGQPRGASAAPRIGSTTGQIVFESFADNLLGLDVDTNGVLDVYRAER